MGFCIIVSSMSRTLFKCGDKASIAAAGAAFSNSLTWSAGESCKVLDNNGNEDYNHKTHHNTICLPLGLPL